MLPQTVPNRSGHTSTLSKSYLLIAANPQRPWSSHWANCWPLSSVHKGHRRQLKQLPTASDPAGKTKPQDSHQQIDQPWNRHESLPREGELRYPHSYCQPRH
mmetsp:Transcript_72379/g.127623  ORF Transcript_72379/g.127623 Transcript_72379/m.127623 type:complete len:102 (-) Transcript_72379:1370-1675(-)